MANFLATTMVGIVMVDRKLNVRKFTEYIADEFSVAEHDVGRSLRYIAYHFATVDLIALCHQVLQTMQPVELGCASVAGKTYAFAADTWSADSDEEYACAELVQVQKVGSQPYTNVLAVVVRRGQTAADGAHLEAIAQASLMMNVPDANNKGAQEDIAYVGELYRDNSKIQGYLNAVLGAVGYYTVALVPAGAPWAYDAPAGNGYVTITIDNKGKAKVAGQLADGTTKPTYASFAAVMSDGTVRIPVFFSKAPACFGGTITLKKGDDGRYVVDSSSMLLWNNDNAALTYWGEEGWRLELEPVGGYFNTLVNIQAHYLTCAFSVATADVSELPVEALTSGYSYSTDAQPNETDVIVKGNAFSTSKRKLAKSGRTNDLAASVNPCNVQVKLARATGLVSGSMSVWTENGSTVYTATAVFDGQTYTDTKTVSINATGHHYGEPVWNWNGTSSATADFTCGNCGDVQTVQAVITSSTTPATQKQYQLMQQVIITVSLYGIGMAHHRQQPLSLVEIAVTFRQFRQISHLQVQTVLLHTRLL